MSDIQEKILREKIIAVLVLEAENEVKPVIESLLEGGVTIIELTLRSAYAMTAIARVLKEYPEMTVGIGTVLTPQQVVAIKELGVPFAVAPGLNRKVLAKAEEVGLEFYPGITTASELESGLEYGKRIMKFFPGRTCRWSGVSYKYECSLCSSWDKIYSAWWRKYAESFSICKFKDYRSRGWFLDRFPEAD